MALVSDISAAAAQTRVDLKLAGPAHGTKLVFASCDYNAGQLTLVPLTKYLTIAVEGKAKHSGVEIKVMFRRVRHMWWDCSQ